MHVEERERLILEAMAGHGFVTYRALEASLSASPATIRRDLSRLEQEGKIARVRGGAKLLGDGGSAWLGGGADWVQAWLELPGSGGADSV